MGDGGTEWYRVGGRRLQFYATDDEIAEWLVEMLPADYAPYVLIGQEWCEGQWLPFEYPLDEIRKCFAERRNANLSIRSDVLSTHLRADDDAQVSLSGLILVQLGRERNGRVEDASIAIVDRIRHGRDGREHRHVAYLRIFERLRRSMRKRLVVTTSYTFPDGSVDTHWPMTPRAAEAHTRGDVVFAAVPVGLKNY